MDDKRVAAVLFYFIINRGQGQDNYIIEYIMINRKGEYTRREYNTTVREWLYHLQWYQTTAESEFEHMDARFLCKWCFRNINIPTVSHILKHRSGIPLEFAKVQSGLQEDINNDE